MHEGSGGTQQILYCINEHIIGFSGPSNAISAHVVLECVDEGGVKLAARIVVWRERFTLLCNLQSLTPLST